MIINEHKLIFVHIPKTAGRSIARAFGSDFLHRTIHAYKSHNYHKFTVVRNPWDRLVSIYHYIGRRSYFANSPIRCSGAEFSQWLQLNLANRQTEIPDSAIDGNRRSTHSLLGSQFWFSSQLSWIAGRHRVIRVDTILRFENLKNDFDMFCKSRDIQVQLPHINASDRRPYQEYYDRSLVGLVMAHYSKEISYFGYKFNR